MPAEMRLALRIGANAICDHRLALFYSAWLFLPAALVSWLLLPEPESDAR